MFRYLDLIIELPKSFGEFFLDPTFFQEKRVGDLSYFGGFCIQITVFKDF